MRGSPGHLGDNGKQGQGGHLGALVAWMREKASRRGGSDLGPHLPTRSLGPRARRQMAVGAATGGSSEASVPEAGMGSPSPLALLAATSEPPPHHHCRLAEQGEPSSWCTRPVGREGGTWPEASWEV